MAARWQLFSFLSVLRLTGAHWGLQWLMTLPTKVHLVKAMVFPIVRYGCESWTIKKAECWRIDAFELWCWRKLLRVPWTARKSNQSILKEISPYSYHVLFLFSFIFLINLQPQSEGPTLRTIAMSPSWQTALMHSALSHLNYGPFLWVLCFLVTMTCHASPVQLQLEGNFKGSAHGRAINVY